MNGVLVSNGELFMVQNQKSFFLDRDGKIEHLPVFGSMRIAAGGSQQALRIVRQPK